VTDRVNILLVDDHEENLVALGAILEPLGETLVLAHSGEEALRCLLAQEVAVILLDAQMPGLDGFETAALIKQRAKTRTIPIIFLTAISKEEEHVFRGYSAGAVDYLLKPFDPNVLRTKVAVFVDLHRKNLELRRQAELSRESELTSARRESEQRYRALADAMPKIVWTAGPDGKATYYNRRWYEYTGLSPGPPTGDEWISVVHPDDLQRTLDIRRETLSTGEIFEVEYRFRSADGSYRWHLGRAVPLRHDDTGPIDFWVGTATDIDAQKRTQQSQEFLLRTGAVLAESLDYRRALQSVARLAVPEIADWCSVDLLEEDGSIHPLALTHADPAKVTFATELAERYPPDPAADTGVPRVIRNGEAEIVPDITDEMLEAVAVDELHLGLIRELGLRSYMCVPLVVREDVVGAISFVAAESGRRFDNADLRVAEELARRAATAIDNARLYRQAEERAQAAGVLAAIGDGVVLLDEERVVRLWNKAATAITGIPGEAVLGKRISEAWTSFAEALPRIPVGSYGAPVPADSIPVDAPAREIWLSISGVEFEAGTVYAFRDLTEERALEQMRQDLVATVSHELRTPLAAIYGSALTLRRTDLELDETIRDKLLDVISEESSRLADIVNDLLLASQLDAGTLQVKIERCDVRELVESAVESARTYLPEHVKLEFEKPGGEIPPVAADEGQLRQVVANLIDNAVKYSPEGGDVQIKLEPASRCVRFSIADRGLGVPASEQARIFEKFYRLDPAMTRGIGGTGLGLYICRELLRRIDGRIWVEPNDGRGSVFHVEVPVATERKRTAA